MSLQAAQWDLDGAQALEHWTQVLCEQAGQAEGPEELRGCEWPPARGTQLKSSPPCGGDRLRAPLWVDLLWRPRPLYSNFLWDSAPSSGASPMASFPEGHPAGASPFTPRLPRWVPQREEDSGKAQRIGLAVSVLGWDTLVAFSYFLSFWHTFSYSLSF